MKYLNITQDVRHSPEFAGATTEQQGVWLNLALYCVEQENWGNIAGARAWNPRQWMALVGIEPEQVAEDSPLWSWIDDDLHIMFYPVSQHKNFLNKRRVAGIRHDREQEPEKEKKEKREEEEEEEGRATAHAKASASESTSAPAKFTPPTVTEVEEFRRAEGLRLDANLFVNHYQGQAWIKTGGQPVTDWQATARVWALKDEEKHQQSKGTGGGGYTGMTSEF